MTARNEDHIGQFLEMMAAERGAARNTLDAYRRDLDDFARYIGARPLDFAKVGSHDITAYLRTCTEQGLAPASRARRLAAIRQFYKFLAAETIVAEDPAFGLANASGARAASCASDFGPGASGRRSS